MKIRSEKLNVSSEEKCLQRRLETVQGRRVANGARQAVPCRRTCDDECTVCTSAELCPRPLNYKVAASRRPSSTFNATKYQRCSGPGTLQTLSVPAPRTYKYVVVVVVVVVLSSVDVGDPRWSIHGDDAIFTHITKVSFRFNMFAFFYTNHHCWSIQVTGEVATTKHCSVHWTQHLRGLSNVLVT